MRPYHSTLTLVVRSFSLVHKVVPQLRASSNAPARFNAVLTGCDNPVVLSITRPANSSVFRGIKHHSLHARAPNEDYESLLNGVGTSLRLGINQVATWLIRLNRTRRELVSRSRRRGHAYSSIRARFRIRAIRCVTRSLAQRKEA